MTTDPTTPDVAPGVTVPDAAVEAGAIGLCDRFSRVMAEAGARQRVAWDDDNNRARDEFRSQARAALTAALPHLHAPVAPITGRWTHTDPRHLAAIHVQPAPPPPDGLDVTDAMVEAGCYAWDMTGDQHDDVRAILEAALAVRPQASPAPAAPTETLDEVLADIEAMGWEVTAFSSRSGVVRCLAMPHDDDATVRAGTGPTELEAAIALRDRLRAAIGEQGVGRGGE